MPAANDREFNLQRLSAENGRWAAEELRLIETIREHKRKLAELPDIICRLNKQLEHTTAEMNRTSVEHDALEAAAEGEDAKRLVAWERARAEENAELEAMDDAEFRAWTDDQADDYADYKLTVAPPQPDESNLFEEPRPNPFGLFRR